VAVVRASVPVGRRHHQWGRTRACSAVCETLVHLPSVVRGPRPAAPLLHVERCCCNCPWFVAGAGAAALVLLPLSGALGSFLQHCAAAAVASAGRGGHPQRDKPGAGVLWGHLPRGRHLFHHRHSAEVCASVPVAVWRCGFALCMRGVCDGWREWCVLCAFECVRACVCVCEFSCWVLTPLRLGCCSRAAAAKRSPASVVSLLPLPPSTVPRCTLQPCVSPACAGWGVSPVSRNCECRGAACVHAARAACRCVYRGPGGLRPRTSCSTAPWTA
jgi:hypothetical protein